MTVANKKFQQLKRKVHAINSWKNLQEKEESNKLSPFTGEQKCQKCGFKARYQFVRCPQCDEVQK